MRWSCSSAFTRNGIIIVTLTGPASSFAGEPAGRPDPADHLGIVVMSRA